LAVFAGAIVGAGAGTGGLELERVDDWPHEVELQLDRGADLQLPHTLPRIRGDPDLGPLKPARDHVLRKTTVSWERSKRVQPYPIRLVNWFVSK
jgi:hypothetical protein